MKFSNYRNYESRNRNIYSKKNLLDMRLSELLDRENELAFQYNTIGIPTDEDLTNSRFAYQYTDDNGVTGWRAGESPDLMGFAASKDKSFEKDFSLLPKGQPKIVMGGPEYPKDIVHNYSGVDDKIAEAIEPKRKHLPIADPPFVLNHSAYEEKQPNQLLQGGVSMEYNPDQEISASETSKQIPVYNENEQNPQGVLKGGISNDPEDSPTNPFDDKEAGIVPVSTKRVENNSDAGEEGLPQKDSVPEDPYLTEDELLGDVMTDQQIAESAKDVNEAFHKALAQKHAQEKEPYFTEEELLGGESSNKTKSKLPLLPSLQSVIAKKAPVEDHPEVEYYRTSFILDQIKKGNVPKWFSKNNQYTNLKNISNKNLTNVIKEKVAKSENTSVDKLSDIDVVITKSNSTLNKYVSKSPDLQHYIKENLGKLKSGETVSGSFEFKNSEDSDSDDIKNVRNKLAKTVHYTDVHDMKMDKDGNITLTLVDYYDFAPGGGFINNNAYLQQEAGILSNYVLLCPVKLKVSDYIN